MHRLVPFLCLFILLTGCKSSEPETADSPTPSLSGPEFASWATTPPMGWNSWDSYGPTVREDEVKANADYMAENLMEYGWEYVVVDIRWFVENTKSHGYNQDNPIYVLDEYGRYLPATNRFPSAAGGQGFKPLADYIHGKGLKFGIHIMRGIPTEAVERKLPIKGADGVTADQVYTTENQCRWLRDNYTIVAGRPGAQEYYNSIFELYAEWGVDFIKIDDLSAPIYHKDEIEMIRKAIDLTGREIVLSTSPGPTPVEFAEHVDRHANMWRMVNDVWDSWDHIDHLFDVSQDWYPYIGGGTWPDCDMIPLGRLSIRGERGDDRMAALTPDEQYTLITLFTIFKSPLMFGGDLPSNDGFTQSLLTNKEVLRMHRESEDVQLIFSDGAQVKIASHNRSEDWTYLALFNREDSLSRELTVDFAELGLEGEVSVTDMWTGEELGSANGSFSRTLAPHASGLYRLE
ncbi:glycoside hydrolase family 27 protein [Lewinella sp. IMCC34191]|uniref:glycoside hydrolase family 27 protein n=1 Tax=Lewinella sp. IMCC34191 TaxID=2259172 RepID=UPI000E254636|nr:glycoside hydrolase family 27 protein [Lewinella sp. IMCC34191]